MFLQLYRWVLVVGFVGGWRDGAFLPSGLLSGLPRRFSGFSGLAITVRSRFDFGYVHDIGFEEVGDLPDVVGLEFFPVDVGV